MRESSSRFGRSVACGAIVIGFAAVQALLASQAEAVPGLQRTTRTSVSELQHQQDGRGQVPRWQARARWRRYGHGRSRPGGPGAAGAGADRHRRSFRGRCARGWERLLAATGGSPPTRCAPARFRATGSSPRRRAARARIPRRTPSPSVSANPRSDLGGASTAAPDRFT